MTRRSQLAFLVSRLLVAVAATWVRRDWRRRWREEWLGELWHEARGGRYGLGLVLRSRGAWIDALYTHRLPVCAASSGGEPGDGVNHGKGKDMWIQDLRYAVRVLVKKPGFTAVAVLTLALGVGSCAAIFSVFHAVVLRPLPWPEPEELVMVWGYHPEIGTETASLPDFLDWRQEAGSFRRLVAFFSQNQTLTGGDTPERIRGARVSHDFLDTLGARPVQGRLFLASEDQAQAPRVVVLSHGLWQRRFAGEEDVVGQTLPLNGEPYEIIGVADADFDFPKGTEVWRALALDPNQLGRRADFLNVIGRLNEGVGAAQAGEEMVTLMARLEKAYPATNAGWSARVVPLHEQVVGEVRPVLFVLLGAVGFVLLIACANVANLLLARSSGRRSEMAVRAVLGATRGRVLRQLAVEALLLAGGGAGLGLLLAVAGVEALKRFGPQEVPRLDTVAVDATALLFIAGMGILTGLLFGLIPAWQTVRRSLRPFLQQGGRAGVTLPQARFRSALVTGQVALAIVLLIGAGLLIRSFHRLGRTDVGFRVEGITTFEVALPSADYPEDTQVLAFFQELSQRVEALPGVVSTGGITSVPVRDGAPYLSFGIQGQPPLDPAAVQDAEVMGVLPGYFSTLGIPVVQGRGLSRQDRADSELVAVVNQRMAERYWPGTDPRGARVTLVDSVNGPWMTIVGVVGDTRQSSLEEEPYPQLYVPFTQGVRPFMNLVLRSEQETGSLIQAVRGLVREMDPNLPVFHSGSFTEILSEALARPRFNTYLLVVFAAAALILAAVGLYGVLAFLVAQRTRELGLRMALGARPWEVLLQVMRQGTFLVGTGAVVGFLAALGLSRLLGRLLFGVSPLDPATYVAVPCLMAAVALVAMWVPALRASRVDPVVALRDE